LEEGAMTVDESLGIVEKHSEELGMRSATRLLIRVPEVARGLPPPTDKTRVLVRVSDPQGLGPKSVSEVVVNGPDVVNEEEVVDIGAVIHIMRIPLASRVMNCELL
jgi:hypothetical protein